MKAASVVVLWVTACVTAFQPLVQLSLSANEEIIDAVDDFLTNSVKRGVLNVEFKKTVTNSPMAQLEIKMETWTKPVQNQLMLPAQRKMIIGAVIDAMRAGGQQYVEAFQHAALQSDKWRALAHDVVQHRLEAPSVLSDFVGSANTAFVLFYKDDSSLANHISAVGVSIARQQLHETEIIIADCTHDAETCAGHHITQFPALRLYRHGKAVATRLGALCSDDVVDWVERLLQPSLAHITEQQVPLYREGALRHLTRQRSLHILFAAEKRQPYSDFSSLAAAHHGEGIFAALIDDSVSKWAIQPAVVTMKPTEQEIRALSLYQNLTAEDMEAYFRIAEEPLLFDFSRAVDVAAAARTELPVLVLFDPFAKTAHRVLHQTAAENFELRKRELKFATINGTNPFALSILTSLGVKQFDRVQWVLYNAKKAASYVFPFEKHELVNILSLKNTPEKLAQPREVLENIIHGEMYSEARAYWRTSCVFDRLANTFRTFIEPGTLPRPPLANEHEEL